MVRLSRKRRPHQRPGEILHAALDLFSERGFTAARLEDIAARAGLSKGAIYLYFDDKAMLLQAIVQDMATEDIASLRALVMEDNGPAGHRVPMCAVLVACGGSDAS